ncbi:MAG: hypothetical protein IPO67_00755 [Deltaproteobacteria bacterium]|nr:hypothetical protein [Deltaproteobacteria bacterium]
MQDGSRSRHLPATVGMALVVLFFSLFGLVNTTSRYQDRERRAIAEAERDLGRLADRWEERVSDAVIAFMDNLDPPLVEPSLAELERTRSERTPWLQALYLWRDERGVRKVVYPTEPPDYNLPALNSESCIRQATSARELGDEAEARVAYALCADHGAEPALRLFARVQLVQSLLDAGLPQDALLAADAAPLPARIDESLRGGLPLTGVLSLQQLAASAARDSGDRDGAARRLTTLGEEIGALRGPGLDRSLGKLKNSVIPDLRDLGAAAEARALEPLAALADRRLAGWGEFERGLLRNASPETGLHAVFDQYAPRSYLLVWTWLPNDQLFAAVQIDQPTLLDELLGEQAEQGSLDTHLIVRTVNDVWVAGGDDVEGVAVQQPLGGLLAHLKLAYTESRLTDARSENTRQTLAESVSVFVMSLMGVWALLALQNAYRKEQELLDRQREFVTRVTHELKTPLAGIRVMAESLELIPEQDPRTIESYAGRIVTESDRLTSRIEEILAVARAQTPAAKAPYELRELLNQIAEEWAPRMNDAGVRLHLQLGDRPVPISGDAKLVRDALVCLLDNALKYRNTERRDPQVWLALRQDGRYATVEVFDNGIGVPANKRKAIFERFVRIEGPGRGKQGGHGLGLAFVAQAVLSQRGRVECREATTGGARFIVRLPLS